MPFYFQMEKSRSNYKKRCLYSTNILYIQRNILEISSKKSSKSIEPSRFLNRLKTKPSEYFITGSHSHQLLLSLSSHYNINKKERLAVIIILISLYCLSLDKNIVDNKLLIIVKSIRYFLRFLILEAAVEKNLFKYFNSLILDLIYII